MTSGASLSGMRTEETGFEAAFLAGVLLAVCFFGGISFFHRKAQRGAESFFEVYGLNLEFNCFLGDLPCGRCL